MLPIPGVGQCLEITTPEALLRQDSLSRMARFTKSPMLLALSAISEAHATHYLKECPSLAVHRVQALIPTTSILNVHCKIELLELHPSDNREEALQQEGMHMRNMTPHHQENYVAA